MGGTDKFSFNKEKNAAKTFTYQFIVDFSKTKIGDRITIDSDKKLEVSLSLTAGTPKDTSQSAPNIPTAGNTHISLGIKSEAEFTLTSAGVASKSATLNCAYNPSVGDASIWNGRKTALILTAPETAPADLTLTAVIAGNTTLYTMNSDRKFIIPLDKIDNKEVNITLNSYLFGLSQDLEFIAQWYVSESRADKSPLNGYNDNAAICNVIISCKKDTLPSVRIDGTTHRCSVGGQLSVDVNYADIPIGEKTITAYLQSKNGEQYVDTGAKKEILHTTGTGDQEIEFSMGQMTKGSYRILVIVQESGANILQVPYYFVIV